MRRNAALIVFLLAGATRIAAQPAIGTLVLSTEPGTAVAGGSVVLRIEEYTRAEHYSPAIVQRWGRLVYVYQEEFINTIAVIEGYGAPHWSSRSIDLGRFAPGDHFVLLDQQIHYYPDYWRLQPFLMFHVEPAEERRSPLDRSQP